MTTKPTPMIRYCMAPTDSPWEPITRAEAAQRLANFRRHRLAVKLRRPGRYYDGRHHAQRRQRRVRGSDHDDD